jgi:O-antigen ligase
MRPPEPQHGLLSAALILAAVAALATEHLYHYPIGIMALWGLWRMARRPAYFTADPLTRLLTLLFACIWIPMLASTLDAVNATRSLHTTVLYLHFLPAAIFIAAAMRAERVRRAVTVGASCIVLFWCGDALAQYFFGSNAFGYPYDGGVLTGAFYPKQRLGLVLAVFAPVYFAAIRRLESLGRWRWLLLTPIALVVLLSLKRTAWIMFTLAVLGYLACANHSRRLSARAAMLVVAALVALTIATGALVPNLRTQALNTARMLSAEYAVVDLASGYRLSLWHTGVRVFSDNPVNGIGPRGYRYAYRDYAAPSDYWLAQGLAGQTHPHMTIIEIAAETGAIGLLGYLLMFGLITRTLGRSLRADSEGWVWMLCALIAWFPINAHLAFYGSYWSSLVWLLLGIGVGASPLSRRP